MMGIFLTILMGFAAVGFDLSYVRLARLEMKNATDAAAHAAIMRLRATGNESTARTKAKDIAALNTVLGKSLTLQDNDVVFGTWDPTSKSFTQGATPATAVKINGVRESSTTNDGYIKLTFGRVLGYTESSITSDVMGAFVNRNFVIELDITPSYICDIDDAVKATLALLDDLHGKNVGGDRISMDLFTGKATEFTAFKNIRDDYTWIRDKWNGGGGSYVSFLDGTKTAGIVVCNKNDDTNTPKGGYFKCPAGAADRPYPNYSWVQHCSEDGPSAGYYGGTDLAAAITAGTNKLVAQTQAYEPRVLILVTDGSPMTCTGPGGGGLCGRTYASDGVSPPAGKTYWDPCCADGLTCSTGHVAGEAAGVTAAMAADWNAACSAAQGMATAATAAANNAKANKIALFTIKVKGSSTATSTTFAKGLARSPGTGDWISDATQLAGKFSNIVGQIPVALVK